MNVCGEVQITSRRPTRHGHEQMCDRCEDCRACLTTHHRSKTAPSWSLLSVLREGAEVARTGSNRTATNNLEACFMRAPFFASERVPRRRGQTSRSRVQILRAISTSAASPRGLLFSTHARWSDVGRTTPSLTKAVGSRTSENKISAGGQKPRTTKRSGVDNANAGQDLHFGPSRSSHSQTSGSPTKPPKQVS